MLIKKIVLDDRTIEAVSFHANPRLVLRKALSNLIKSHSVISTPTFELIIKHQKITVDDFYLIGAVIISINRINDAYPLPVLNFFKPGFDADLMSESIFSLNQKTASPFFILRGARTLNPHVVVNPTFLMHKSLSERNRALLCKRFYTF